MLPARPQAFGPADVIDLNTYRASHARPPNAPAVPSPPQLAAAACLAFGVGLSVLGLACVQLGFAWLGAMTPR